MGNRIERAVDVDEVADEHHCARCPRGSRGDRAGSPDLVGLEVSR